MDPRAHPEGEPLVCRVANQAVAEAEPPLTVGFDERRESGEHGGIQGEVVRREDALEDLAPEAATQDRAVAQDSAYPRVELVDLGAHGGVHRLRQFPERPGPQGEPGHLLDEERVALGAFDDGGHLVRPQRRRLGRCVDEALHDLAGQWAEHHPNRGLRCEPALVAPAHDEHGPRSAGRRERDPGEERGRGAVGPVRLLDDEGHGAGDQPPEEIDDDIRRPVTAVLRVDAVGFERGRNVHLGDVRQQRRHRQEVGRGPPQSRQQGSAHDLGLCAGDAQEGAQRVTQHPIGARRAVGLPADHQLAGARPLDRLLERLVGQT